MTSFLVFIILVLIGIAVWQLTKIFDLTQIGGSSDTDEIANDRDSSVNGYMMFALVGLIYVFTICSLYAWCVLV